MNKIKFVLEDLVRQPGSKVLASFEISPQGEDYYCHLELGRANWTELRRLISLNYWLEWDENGQDSPPRLRLSKRAFLDQLSIPRCSQQSQFGHRLPGILQKDADGWHVVDYELAPDCLKLTFAHASQTAGNEDDLVQVQIDFFQQYTCRTEPA